MNYSELTRRYFHSAPGAGVLEGANVQRGAAGGRAQGTWVQFDVQSNCGIIKAVRFLAFGCPHTIAVAAWVAERAVGAAPAGVLPESVPQLSERFEVPIEKRGRLLIIEDAWAAATAGAAQRQEALLPGRPPPYG